MKGWGERRKLKRNLATETYGGNRTIHRTGEVNVELDHGRVVSVWFRCRALPFTQHEVDSRRAGEMDRMYRNGVNVRLDSVDLVPLADDEVDAW